MKKNGSLTLLLCGVALAIIGYSATNSLDGDLASFFTRSGSPADNGI